MHVIVWFDMQKASLLFLVQRNVWHEALETAFSLVEWNLSSTRTKLFLMSFLVLFIAAARWRECGALTRRRRGVEKPFVKANVPPWPSRKRRERAHGSSSQARRLRRGGRTKPDRAVPNLSAEGGISSVKRGKRRATCALFVINDLAYS